MPDLGVHLMLSIGPNVPVPAPYDVMDALVSLEVNNNDKQRDGFQMTFAVGKSSPLDYNLLLSGLLDPPSIVSIMVIFGALPQVLINGMITKHQFVPSNKPGESTLHVTGEDIGLKFDLEEKSTTYPNMPDFAIVSQIILQNGLIPEVTPTTDVPLVIQRVPTQQGTDLSYIRKLAERNGFVFYTVPTLVPGISTGYWGPENRLGVPQPALTMNMGSDTNVDTPINFSLNALGPATPKITIIVPITDTPITIPVPSGIQPPLTLNPVPSLRTTIARDVANLNPMDAALKAVSSVTDTADAVTATGTVDAVRYGRALQSRQLVGVRGVGFKYDGIYYVKQVKHSIKPGEYKQSFTLTREGLGSLTPAVVP
jgi:hypothetical protein